jgi:hypothetical protein
MMRDINKNQEEEIDEANALDIEEEVKHEKAKGAPRAIVVNKSQRELTEPMITKQTQKPLTTISDPYAAKQGPKKDGSKFSEFLIAEKQRKFIRVPRLYGKRQPMVFKCPYCKSDKE